MRWLGLRLGLCGGLGLGLGTGGGWRVVGEKGGC